MVNPRVPVFIYAHTAAEAELQLEADAGTIVKANVDWGDASNSTESFDIIGGKYSQ